MHVPMPSLITGMFVYVSPEREPTVFGLFNSTQQSYTTTSCKQLHDAFSGETPAVNNQDLGPRFLNSTVSISRKQKESTILAHATRVCNCV